MSSFYLYPSEIPLSLTALICQVFIQILFSDLFECFHREHSLKSFMNYLILSMDSSLCFQTQIGLLDLFYLCMNLFGQSE